MRASEPRIVTEWDNRPMCGRFALHAHPDVIALQFELGQVPALAPRYNIAPSAEVLIVRGAAQNTRSAALVRWGLVPHWAKDATIGAKLNNARAETAAVKPSFRDAYRKRRCLVPASGYYEWRAEGKVKQPYYIHPSESTLCAFAGLWESWNGPGGPLETCAILTTDANEKLALIHDRMPVIIAPDHYGRWLDHRPENEVADLLRPCADGDIETYPVDRAVSNARNESPELISRFGN